MLSWDRIARGMKAPAAVLVIWFFVLAAAGAQSSRQAAAAVDFARDVQPILTTRCVGCHGPALQQAGYRLDRRSTALGGVVRPNIIPGNSQSSRFYQRVIGTLGGSQMPPTGPLAQEEIDTLRRWVDEGAHWPDALANEIARAAEDPSAVRLVESIRARDWVAVRARVAAEPAALNARGPAGETPLMAAALDGDASLAAELLKAGADPNVRNDAGASALMWAIEDLDKVRVLIDRNIDVNAISNFGRSALDLAVALPDPMATVTLLLEHRAKPSQNALTATTRAGRADVVRRLVAAGARDNGAAALAAIRAGCRDCLDAIAGGKPLPPISGAVGGALAPSSSGDAEFVRLAIAHGGDVDVRDGKQRTPLMLAAISQTLPPESIRLLIDRGADVDAMTPDGRTALFFARRLGRTPIVDVLEQAGATSAADSPGPTAFVTNNTIEDAIRRSVPLLQRTGVELYRQSGCVTCHHNLLTTMTVAAVRAKGFAVDEDAARDELTTTVRDVRATREQALQGIVSPGGGPTTAGYILMALAAARHEPDAGTDALVTLLRRSQRANGLWESAFRPPTEASEITAAAVSVRGIQLYGRPSDRPRNDAVVRAARVALEKASPIDTEDRVFRLLGLRWAGASPAITQSASRDLLAAQRADGGWAQLPTLDSDAYATGSALVALHEAGMRADHEAYRRGVAFLLKTQLTDGSWFVRTRTHATQTYRDSGFPHGEHQFISAAATNWATQALAYGR